MITKEESFLSFLLAIQLFPGTEGDYTDIFLASILAQEMKVSRELKVSLIVVVIDLVLSLQ